MKIIVFLGVCPERAMSGPLVASVFLSSVLFVVLQGHKKHDQEYRLVALICSFSTGKGCFSSITLFLGRFGVNMGLICILNQSVSNSADKYVCIYTGRFVWLMTGVGVTI